MLYKQAVMHEKVGARKYMENRLLDKSYAKILYDLFHTSFGDSKVSWKESYLVN